MSLRLKTCLRLARKLKRGSSRSIRTNVASVSPSRQLTTPMTSFGAKRKPLTVCGPVKTWLDWNKHSKPPKKSTGRATARNNIPYHGNAWRTSGVFFYLQRSQDLMEKPHIIAYLKTTCGWSSGVRAVLKKYDLPYEEKDIIKN